MNSKRNFLAFATAGFLATAPAEAQGETNPTNPLVGVWQLVGMGVYGQGKRHIDLPFGPNPTGTLICLPSGVHSRQILSDHPPVQKTPGILPLAADNEKLQAAVGYDAQFGTYSVDGQMVTFHLQAALWPNRVGIDDMMRFKVSGDKLFTSQPRSWHNYPFEERMEWKRLNVEPKGQVYSLVSVEVLTPDGKPEPKEGKWMGAQPTGQLIDLSAGYYALQVMRDPRPQWSGDYFPEASKKDKLAVVLGNYADYGTYTYDPATAVSTSHILGSLWPNLRGHDLKTHPQMDGDRFINTTDPIDTGKGNALVYRWTWEPIK